MGLALCKGGAISMMSSGDGGLGGAASTGEGSLGGAETNIISIIVSMKLLQSWAVTIFTKK